LASYSAVQALTFTVILPLQLVKELILFGLFSVGLLALDKAEQTLKKLVVGLIILF
jgi:hypothetical protein